MLKEVPHQVQFLWMSTGLFRTVFMTTDISHVGYKCLKSWLLFDGLLAFLFFFWWLYGLNFIKILRTDLIRHINLLELLLTMMMTFDGDRLLMGEIILFIGILMLRELILWYVNDVIPDHIFVPIIGLILGFIIVIFSLLDFVLSLSWYFTVMTIVSFDFTVIYNSPSWICLWGLLYGVEVGFTFEYFVVMGLWRLLTLLDED